MTICACCGFKSDAVLRQALTEGCASCGACPVGEPLPRPEHELPSYGRALVLAVTGSLLVLAFIAQTISSFTKNLPTTKTTKEAFYAAGAGAIDFWAWVSAAETAAWRLKWMMIPVSLLVLFGSRKLYRSIKESPARFCGLRQARRGYLASAAVPLLVLILISITVPERLSRRQDGIEAGFNAHGQRFNRAFDEYREQFGTLPSDLIDLRRLPDADGSLAAALKEADVSEYKPSAEVASVPKKKPKPFRGAVISNASLDTAETLNEGLSFTNYELRLPGYDKLLNTEDDLILRDGFLSKAADLPRRPGTPIANTQTGKP